MEMTVNNHLVIGLMYGDEGKGRIVSALCHKYKEINGVVRFSGGPQAAHCVKSTDNYFEHIYASLGSGSHLGKTTYITRDVMVNPQALMTELIVLNSKLPGDKYKTNELNIRISPDAKLITPFDILRNKEDIVNVHNGTTGMGVRKAIIRHALIPLYVKDIFHPEVLRQKIDNYYANVGPWQEEGIMEYWDETLDEYMQAALDMRPYIDPTVKSLSVFNDSDNYNVVFESAQGLLLDPGMGFFPNVTASRVLPPRLMYTDDVWLVVRAYSTRHGAGPMLLENSISDPAFAEGINNPHEINKGGGFQGDLRLAPFSHTLLKYSLSKFCDHYANSGLIKRVNLVVTCMDCVQDLNDSIDPIKKEIFLTEIYNTFRGVMTDGSDVLNRHEPVDSDPYRLYYTKSPYQEDFPTRFK